MESNIENTTEERQQFWKSVCEETNFSKQLMEKSEASLIEIDFNLARYGKVHISAKPAVPLGTNFMSDVFTTTAHTENGKELTAFVKVLPSNPSRLAAGFIGGSYHREFVVYGEWLPQLRDIRVSKGLTDADLPLNVAQAYHVNLALSEDGKNLLGETVYVIEELKSKGYRMASQSKTATGIDYSHAKVAMETYAAYHALSIANLRKFKSPEGTINMPTSYEPFLKDPNYISPAVVYRTLVLPSYSKILRHFHQEETADWLDALIPKLEEIWNWESFVNGGHLTCLLHGDSWNNNLLFRYPTDESNVPETMLLIDWQIARCGHVCHDLGYFLCSSTSSDFRREHMHKLFVDYFASLKSALKQLDIDLDSEGYTQEQFLREAKDRYVLMMCIALFILPILLDSSKAADHTLKTQDSSKDVKTASNTDGGQAADLDEETTKDGWQSLFEPKTVIANSILSKRVVELIVDIREMSI